MKRIINEAPILVAISRDEKGEILNDSEKLIKGDATKKTEKLLKKYRHT